eukprot:GHVN01106353.1.p1 GENE.GHVN01106353.1~~GHVN01106353.1.p1  ORF type:complete len:1214 (-),score=185.50 GHVN01106353.1:296-3895(-)
MALSIPVPSSVIEGATHRKYENKKMSILSQGLIPLPKTSPTKICRTFNPLGVEMGETQPDLLRGTCDGDSVLSCGTRNPAADTSSSTQGHTLTSLPSTHIVRPHAARRRLQRLLPSADTTGTTPSPTTSSNASTLTSHQPQPNAAPVTSVSHPAHPPHTECHKRRPPSVDPLTRSSAKQTPLELLGATPSPRRGEEGSQNRFGLRELIEELHPPGSRSKGRSRRGPSQSPARDGRSRRSRSRSRKRMNAGVSAGWTPIPTAVHWAGSADKPLPLACFLPCDRLVLDLSPMSRKPRRAGLTWGGIEHKSMRMVVSAQHVTTAPSDAGKMIEQPFSIANNQTNESARVDDSANQLEPPNSPHSRGECVWVEGDCYRRRSPLSEQWTTPQHGEQEGDLTTSPCAPTTSLSSSSIPFKQMTSTPLSFAVHTPAPTPDHPSPPPTIRSSPLISSSTSPTTSIGIKVQSVSQMATDLPPSATGPPTSPWAVSAYPVTAHPWPGCWSVWLSPHNAGLVSIAIDSLLNCFWASERFPSGRRETGVRLGDVKSAPTGVVRGSGGAPIGAQLLTSLREMFVTTIFQAAIEAQDLIPGRNECFGYCNTPAMQSLYRCGCSFDCPACMCTGCRPIDQATRSSLATTRLDPQRYPSSLFLMSQLSLNPISIDLRRSAQVVLRRVLRLSTGDLAPIKSTLDACVSLLCASELYRAKRGGAVLRGDGRYPIHLTDSVAQIGPLPIFEPSQSDSRHRRRHQSPHYGRSPHSPHSSHAAPPTRRTRFVSEESDLGTSSGMNVFGSGEDETIFVNWVKSVLGRFGYRRWSVGCGGGGGCGAEALLDQGASLIFPLTLDQGPIGFSRTHVEEIAVFLVALSFFERPTHIEGRRAIQTLVACRLLLTMCQPQSVFYKAYLSSELFAVGFNLLWRLETKRAMMDYLDSHSAPLEVGAGDIAHEADRIIAATSMDDYKLILRVFNVFQQPHFTKPCLSILQQIGRNDPRCLIAVMGVAARRIDQGMSYSNSALFVLVRFFSNFSEVVIRWLPTITESIIRCLDPSDPTLRRNTLSAATSALFQLVKTFPMITFHQQSQRLAVGTAEYLIVIYDLRTATKWHVLEGHTGPLSAVKFNEDGSKLGSYSAHDCTFRVWQCSSYGFFRGILGSGNKCQKTAHLQKAEAPFYNSITHQLHTIRIQCDSKAKWILKREDGRSYVVPV